MKTSKAHFVILLFLIVSGAVLAQRDTVIIQDSIKFTGKMDNKNKKTGKWIGCDQSGTKVFEASYIFGKLNGDLKKYYPSQKIKSHLRLKNDTLLYQAEYFETGNLQFEFTSTASDRLKSGIVKTYYSGGKPQVQGVIDEGKKVGRWYSYDEAEKKTSEDFLVVTKEGSYPRNNVIRHYLKDGTLEYTEHYDFSDCTILTYYDSARKVVSTKYKIDGKIISEKEYKEIENGIGKILLNAIEKSKKK